ncbi:MAG: response regulator [Coriobacteriia bacterium]|nr:response regulator [Coriobacteriia bacterium]
MASETVLVVEDTELLRRIYTDKLTQEGYRVLQAGDGLECVNLLRTTQVDLILLDLVMPRMSGLEALEQVKRDPRTRDIPVIILSNLGQDGDVQRGLDLGAADYLVKNSAKPADVSAKIRATLDMLPTAPASRTVFKVLLRDHEGDADALVEHAKLPRRLWCPACQVELTLELIPKKDREHWYDAHVVCPSCGREY